MIATGWKLALIATCAGGLSVGVRLAASPLVRATLPERREARAAEEPRSPVVSATSLAAAVIERDPFRVARRPAAVAYDPLRVGQAAVLAAPRPTLVLVGIVWDGGRDPTALIEGLPGLDGPRTVRTGDALGALRVRRIERDRVVIVGLDTIWTLRVREPWQ